MLFDTEQTKRSLVQYFLHSISTHAAGNSQATPAPAWSGTQSNAALLKITLTHNKIEPMFRFDMLQSYNKRTI